MACLLALAAAVLAGIGAPNVRAAELTLAQAVTTESCAPESERCASERCARTVQGRGGGCGAGNRDDDRDRPPENPPSGGNGAPPDGDPGDQPTGGFDADPGGSSGGPSGSPEDAALSDPQELGPEAAAGAGGDSGDDDLPFTGLGLGALVLAGLALLAAGLLTARRARRGGHGT